MSHRGASMTGAGVAASALRLKGAFVKAVAQPVVVTSRTALELVAIPASKGRTERDERHPSHYSLTGVAGGRMLAPHVGKLMRATHFYMRHIATSPF